MTSWSRTADLLELDIWSDSGRPVVELSGCIDVYTVAQLRGQLLELSQRGRHLIAVEMSGVTFCDSSGLGVLVGAMKRARDGGGVVVLVGVPENIMRVLRVTGLTKVFPVAANIETALTVLDERHQTQG